jgi:hypothetical protein
MNRPKVDALTYIQFLIAAQRGHIQLALRAFVRLENHWWNSGVSWYQVKADIIRSAIRTYLANPSCILAAESTA